MRGGSTGCCGFLFGEEGTEDGGAEFAESELQVIQAHAGGGGTGVGERGVDVGFVGGQKGGEVVDVDVAGALRDGESLSQPRRDSSQRAAAQSSCHARQGRPDD